VTPAEELVQAADKLAALASEATDGPWTNDARYVWITDALDFGHVIDDDGAHATDLRYIAAMNPLVGKALAEWLYEQASAAAVRNGHSAKALEIARLINGGES
jgi:hypothetical protein